MLFLSCGMESLITELCTTVFIFVFPSVISFHVWLWPVDAIAKWSTTLCASPVTWFVCYLQTIPGSADDSFLMQLVVNVLEENGGKLIILSHQGS